MKKLSSYQVKRGLQAFRKHGVKQFVRRFGEKTGIVETAYPGWFEKHRTSERELAEQRESVFAIRFFSASWFLPIIRRNVI